MRFPPTLPVLVLASALVALAGCVAEPFPSSPPAMGPAATPASSPSRSSPPAPSLVGSPFPAVPSPTASPRASAEATPSLGQFDRLTCGLDETYPAAALERPARDELGPDAAAAALRETIAGPTATELGFPSRGWRIVAGRPDRVTFVADAGDHWAVATIAANGQGAWQFLEGGQCHLAVVLPNGIGFASWRLDPADGLDPDARAISVLGTELACASGRAPGPRLRPPLVVETATSVVIGLLVTTNPNADCPGNPEFPVRVPLSDALGTRTLFDGSSFPPARRS